MNLTLSASSACGGLEGLGLHAVELVETCGFGQGSTENATVAGELMGEWVERGVTFDEPRLYIMDGGKAIRRAILNYAGDAAFIQRCQVHKIPNVTEHLPEEKRHAVKFQMRAGYQVNEAADAPQSGEVTKSV